MASYCGAYRPISDVFLLPLRRSIRGAISVVVTFPTIIHPPASTARHTHSTSHPTASPLFFLLSFDPALYVQSGPEQPASETESENAERQSRSRVP